MELPRTRSVFGTTLTAGLVAAATVGATPASAWFLSPESANDSGVSSAHTLYWLGLVVAVLFIVIVNAVLLSAIKRNRAARGRAEVVPTDSPRAQLRLGGGLAGLFAILLVLGVIFTQKSTAVDAAASEEGDPIHITATGQQWLWRYDYPDDVYSFHRLTVPVGTEIRLNVLSTDVVHSWYVPALSTAVDAVPGRSHRISFAAEQEGVYGGRSAVFSGQGYPAMRTEVAVVSNEEFDQFLERRREETGEAQANAAATYRERIDED